jgi:hypothetical protein
VNEAGERGAEHGAASRVPRRHPRRPGDRRARAGRRQHAPPCCSARSRGPRATPSPRPTRPPLCGWGVSWGGAPRGQRGRLAAADRRLRRRHHHLRRHALRPAPRQRDRLHPLLRTNQVQGKVTSGRICDLVTLPAVSAGNCAGSSCRTVRPPPTGPACYLCSTGWSPPPGFRAVPLLRGTL